MEPSAAWEGRLAKVSGLIQARPTDGAPATERTDIYVGYNEESLVVVFVAFDSRPGNVRARRARREDINNDDDWVEVAIDTFDDRRRAYLFDSNPLGVQWDALWSEGQGEDSSFDTVYHTEGFVTDEGYVLLMAIPFKSLRFPSVSEQTWGIQFQRFMPRVPEQVAWPHISTRVQGRLNQAATLTGLKDISPGRNIQLIPFGTFRSFRALDTSTQQGPVFVKDTVDPDGGIDAKVVIQDSFVLDATANPDFSQVESDDPQITTNQRFEVFFPEKRPFFLENANFFQTPLDLVFTRRIADPQIGARLTGKLGPWAIAALATDDQAEGRLAAPDSAEFGRRARNAVVRINRDLFDQSSLGVVFTDRTFSGRSNRVGGVDGLFRVGENWTGSFQLVGSSTEFDANGSRTGTAAVAEFEREGRQLNFEGEYQRIDEDFSTELGFVNRTGFQSLEEQLSYRFRPEGDILIAWGPELEAQKLWQTDGTPLDWEITPMWVFALTGQTEVRLFVQSRSEGLLPEDFPALSTNRSFRQDARGVFATSSIVPWASLRVFLEFGDALNFEPPNGESPFLANIRNLTIRVALRPSTNLRIRNAFISTALSDTAGAEIFDNTIFRSNWNWQFNNRLSLRFIGQYETLSANPALTRLETERSLNADVLLTYRVNPWTALFAGFNTNSQNLFLCEDPNRLRPGCGSLGAGERRLTRTESGLFNDSRQFFVKFSYLFRF